MSLCVFAKSAMYLSSQPCLHCSLGRLRALGVRGWIFYSLIPWGLYLSETKSYWVRNTCQPLNSVLHLAVLLISYILRHEFSFSWRKCKKHLIFPTWKFIFPLSGVGMRCVTSPKYCRFILSIWYKTFTRMVFITGADRVIFYLDVLLGL